MFSLSENVFSTSTAVKRSRVEPPVAATLKGSLFNRYVSRRCLFWLLSVCGFDVSFFFFFTGVKLLVGLGEVLMLPGEKGHLHGSRCTFSPAGHHRINQ